MILIAYLCKYAAYLGCWLYNTITDRLLLSVLTNMVMGKLAFYDGYYGNRRT